MISILFLSVFSSLFLLKFAQFLELGTSTTISESEIIKLDIGQPADPSIFPEAHLHHRGATGNFERGRMR